jgi:4-amino-4-deoxy-L-arabinose transferase-like glycosyltransferase
LPDRPNLGLAGVIALALVVFVVLFWRLGAASFWDPDEAHYAETTRELLVTGDWWAPYYNQQPFFDKPIFFHQLQAVAMLVAGQNELGARLVPALAALALVLITGWLGATLISVEAGLVAALLLAMNPGVFALARYAILDTLFTALLFGGVGLLAVAALDPVGSGFPGLSVSEGSQIGPPQGGPRRWLQWPGYVLIAGAAMTKGPVAFVLCGLAMGLAIGMSADVRRRLLGLHWIAGVGMALAISAPWFVYMYLRFRGDFVAGYLLDENIRLFASDRFGYQPSPWFYFQILATGLLPWTGVVVGVLVDDVRAAVSHRRADPPDSFGVMLWAWTIAIVAFFTFSRFKLDHYVFPAAPALCLLIARAWSDVRAFPDAPQIRGARIGLRFVGPLLIVLGAGAGYFLLSQLDLPPAAMIVPVIVVAGGIAIAVRANILNARPPRIPWIAMTAVTTIYAGILLFVMPALEKQKVVPDIARWVASHAEPDARIASYQLNRWSTAFRFYVDRHVTMLDDVNEMVEFVNDPKPFYGVMLGEGYDELVARGVPVKEVYAREGMWATSGRALWRTAIPATRFVVVTSRDGTER